MSDLTKNEKMLIEEIKLIQDIIKRLSTNSFSIKTICVTLVVATLLFKGSDKHIFVAFIPLLSFWYLDSYYLRQERLFRKLHKWLVDYRMQNGDRIFDFDISKFDKEVESVCKIMLSKSILLFYGSIFSVWLICVIIS